MYLIVSEKTHRGKSEVTYLLQSLKLNADLDEKDCVAKCCFVSEDRERSSQRLVEVKLTGKGNKGPEGASVPVFSAAHKVFKVP